MAKKRLPRKIPRELMVNARELENLVFVCECDGRIEVNPGGGIRKGARCPQCGVVLDAEREAFELFDAAYSALARLPLVYFRVAPRGKLRVGPKRSRV